MSFLGFDSLGAFGGGLLDKALDFGINMIGTKYANDLNMRNWYKQMDYNAPINQLARLREAGLNPNLIYGSGGVQNTITSAPKMDAPNSKSLDLFAYQQILNGKKQGELLDEQIKKTRTEANNAQLHGLGMIVDNEMKDIEKEYRNLELEYFKKHGTIRGQNVVHGTIDRFENVILRPVGEYIGTKAGEYRDRVVNKLKRSFKGSVPFVLGGVPSSFYSKAYDYGKSLFSYMYDKATSNGFGGRYY